MKKMITVIVLMFIILNIDAQRKQMLANFNASSLKSTSRFQSEDIAWDDAMPLISGVTESNNTKNGTLTIDAYPSVNFGNADYKGRELIYCITAGDAGEVGKNKIEITGHEEGCVDLFIFNYPHLDSMIMCIFMGGYVELVGSSKIKKGEKRWYIFDEFSNSSILECEDSLDITIKVDFPPVELDCSNAIEITLEEDCAGSIADSKSEIQNYGGSTSSYYLGKETVHKFVPEKSGPAIIGWLSGSEPGIDFIVLGSCNKEDVITILEPAKEPQMEFDVEAGKTYYIVADANINHTGQGDYIFRIEMPTGSDIGMKELQKDFNVYPNPCKENLMLELDNTNEGLVEVLDILGKTVLTRKIQIGEGLIDLDMSSLSKGIYIIRINSNGKTIQRKIIKN